MRFKITLLLALLLSGAIFCHGQTRRPTPKPSPSPQATAEPSPTPDAATTQASSPNEMSEAERNDLQTKATQAETTIGLNALIDSVGARTPQETLKSQIETRNAMEQLAEIYGKAARDSQLMRSLMTGAFRTSYDKPMQGNMRLMLIQAAQNQLLIEQNKKIIQLLTELVKARK